MKPCIRNRAVAATGLALALAATPAIRTAVAGSTPPRTPNMDAIARAGVRFRNVWAMPECSPSRAMFFEGRFPLRTNVRNALLDTPISSIAATAVAAGAARCASGSG